MRSFEQGVLNLSPIFVSKQCVLENVLADLNEVMLNGGTVRFLGVTVLFDNPNNLNYYTSPTGYYIRNAQDWLVYFKCRERAKAQLVCNEIFGSGKYFVNSKV